MNMIKEATKLVLFVILSWNSTIILTESIELIFKHLMFRIEINNPILILISTKLLAISLIVSFFLLCVYLITKKYEKIRTLLLFSLLLYIVSLFINFFIGDILSYIITEQMYKQVENYKTFLFSNPILAYTDILINPILLFFSGVLFIFKK